jgi:hypothetical protein
MAKINQKDADLFVSVVYDLGICSNKKIIFTVLYNLIPALIFGPLLVYKGTQYNDNYLVIIGLLLIITDSLHFIKALQNL